MAKYYLNGVLTDSTSEQDTKWAELDAAAKKEKDANTAIKETTATNKTSAITKLKALGLTDDEISALTGVTNE
jgi:hypothetical protein